LFEGTFYLTKVDDKYRRFYAVKQGSSPLLKPTNNGIESGKTAERRLAALDNHFQAKSEQIDATTLRSVITNFHKKPLQE